MEKSEYTPMMQHYLQLKEENPDAILMYRLGDFYEMFFEDAKTVSRELDLVLTGRAAGAEKAPMCGVPHHAVDSYIGRLVKKGYKVAVCEQLSDPKESKGLVDRGIVRIVTPGTWMDSQAQQTAVNYMAVIHCDGYKACLVFCELSTGELRYIIYDRSLSETLKYLIDLGIHEVVMDGSVDKSWKTAISSSEEWVCSAARSIPLTREDEQLLPSQEPILKDTLSLLMGYLQKTQKQHVDHLTGLKPLFPPRSMMLDPETRAHLELVRSESSSAKAISLWEFMDECKSAMGSRRLRSWIEAPLIDREEIRARQEAIQVLVDQFLLREQLKDHLNFIYDLERLAARVSYGSASPRDVLQITSSLEHAKPILELAEALKSFPQFAQVDNCYELYEKIKSAIVEDPPLTLKDGNVIAPGYSAELDEVLKLADSSEEALLEMENKERERTGIPKLKIGYNRVFGYFIEIRNTQLSMIQPEFGYTPKQTLANSTRYITQDLKELEDRILNAQDRKISLEQKLFSDLLSQIKEWLPRLHDLASALADIDVLCGLSVLATEKGYVRPGFTEDGSIHVIEGRHPILEERLSGFVSNGWQMEPDCTIQLITGPNMGGKSTWLRQNAILVIMAQMGSFVPARKAELPIFDRIFTRIGASDDLLQGKSTFMVEMMEANTALKYATPDSLILFDEIGRGTATYDGMALAQAMLEYIHSVLHAKTLFSTHYHELTDLETSNPGIQNVHVDVREAKGKINFRYRIVDGKSDKSYGIHVAKLAHLPSIVLERATTLLQEYENHNSDQNYQPSLFVVDPQEQQRRNIIDRLAEIDPDALSAREALSVIYELQEQIQKMNES